jgi:hypothetical protein
MQADIRRCRHDAGEWPRLTSTTAESEHAIEVEVKRREVDASRGGPGGARPGSRKTRVVPEVLQTEVQSMGLDQSALESVRTLNFTCAMMDFLRGCRVR